jgi:hypothetical protein
MKMKEIIERAVMIMPVMMIKKKKKMMMTMMMRMTISDFLVKSRETPVKKRWRKVRMKRKRKMM